jgi:hypothetical protein
MEHDHSQLNRHTINALFYSEHPKVNGPVTIFNGLNYVMAAYCIQTGVTKWQRVIPAPQRDKVEKWLGTHYPVPVAI